MSRKGACDMKMRLQTGPRAYGRWALGLWLASPVLPAVAQVAPLTTQTLFFDQASNVHRGDYLEVEAGALATDNATLTESPTSDTLAVVGLAADMSRHGSGLDYRLDSDLTLVKYIRENFQTRPTGYLDGDADLKIVPGLLSWTARETYTDVVVNPLAPVTPQNVESLNYLTTGPSLTVRPTLRTTVTADATYSYINSGSLAPGYVDLDDHRYAGDVRVDHALTNTTSLYAMWSTEQVFFRDRVANTNFTENDAFVGFRYVDARTVVDLAGGYDRLHVGGETPAGGTYRAQLSRVISPRQRLYLFALRQITDSASLLRLNIDQPVATSAPFQLVAGGPMTYRSAGADWRFQAERTSFDLAVSDTSQRYRGNATFDNDIKIVDAFLGRQLAPALNMSLGVEFQHQDFSSTISGPLQQVNLIANLRWQAGERLALRLVAAHNALTPHRYAENDVGLIASYDLISANPTGELLTPAPAMLPTSPMSSQQTPH
jgi:hypothetical protein